MRKLTSKTLSIVALVLGIASCAIAMLPNMALPGLAAGIAGAVLAYRVNKKEPTRRTFIALSLSIIGVLLCALMLTIALALNSYTAYLQEMGTIRE